MVEGGVAGCTGAVEDATIIGQDASLGTSWAGPVDEPVGAQEFCSCAVAHRDGDCRGPVSLCGVCSGLSLGWSDERLVEGLWRNVGNVLGAQSQS